MDVSEQMLDYVRKHIEPELGVQNLAMKRVEGDDPDLADASVDRILTVNTWHHIEDRVAYGEKLYRALKAGGKVVDVDYTKGADRGPPKRIKLKPERVVDEFEEAGFDTHIAEEKLPEQYIVVAEKK